MRLSSYAKSYLCSMLESCKITHSTNKRNLGLGDFPATEGITFLLVTSQRKLSYLSELSTSSAILFTGIVIYKAASESKYDNGMY